MAASILVAEDSPTQAENIRTHLAAAGHEVVVAPDGAEAWQLLADSGGSFDLVLSDVVMPEMDGFELCARIREDQDNDLPVVLLTSLSDPHEIIRGLEVGADHFLTKPYDPDDLVRRLGTILENRAMRSSGHLDLGIDVTILGRRLTITRERQQIVELLVSTFENLLQANVRLRERESELARARDDLATELEATELERARIEAVLMAIPDAVFIVAPSGEITDVNNATEQILGLTAEEIRGADISAFGRIVDARGEEVPPQDWPIRRVLDRGESPRGAEEFSFVGRDGRRVPVSIMAAPVSDAAGTVRAAVSVVRDMSLSALHDRITQLPNRTLFADRLQYALTHPDRGVRDVIVAKVLIDQFDEVRGSLGESAAAELLVIAAKRIARRLRPEATLARTGSGEFSILIEGVSEVGDAVQAISRAVAAFERPVTLSTEELYITTSTGVAVAAPQVREAENLDAQARTAMIRAAGQDGIEIELYDPDLHDVVLERLRLERDLHVALEGEEFVVYYQPIVSLETGLPVGAEALVRWEHPQRGLVPPGDFIPVAERGGIIVPIGLWVLRAACAQVVAWRHDGLVDVGFGISVNLSVRQFADPDLVDDVAATLERTGLEPEALTLEVTETAVMDDVEAARRTLDALRTLGIRIALDDFGTGYSSLGYLMDLPVDVLKIDRTFVQHVGSDVARSAITETAIQLGQRLGHVVVAEGIETSEQILWLREAGCDLAAGYLLARPAPAAEVGRLLRTPLIDD